MYKKTHQQVQVIRGEIVFWFPCHTQIVNWDKNSKDKFKSALKSRFEQKCQKSSCPVKNIHEKFNT